MIFATQGGAVDITRWIAGLRAGNPSEYEEVQASFAVRTRANIVQGVVIDSLTAVFLLDGQSVSSVIGRALVSKFGKLFVSYDSASMSLGSAVQSMVPQLQAICKSSLSPANLKLVVQKVVELSLKPHASCEWVKKTIGGLLRVMRAVTNQNCGALLKELTSAVVPGRVLKVRNTTAKALELVEVEMKNNKVCINRRIVCENVCGFSCVRAAEFQKVKQIL